MPRNPATSRDANRKTKQSQRTLRRWHRRFSLTVVAFIVLLTITGVLINHAHHLELDKVAVKQTWLLDWYGIGNPQPVAMVSSDDGQLAYTENLAWLGKNTILRADAPIQQGISTANGWFIASHNKLHWFTPQGRLIDTLGVDSGLPVPVDKLGISAEGNLAVSSISQIYIVDSDVISWQPVSADTPIIWSSPKPATSADYNLLFRSAQLDWQRVLLDLHSGRLFGSLTIWLWDLFALIVLSMAISGIWLWLKKKR